jgi:hypothetical protein
MFNSFTSCSKELGDVTGRIDPGFVKLRFTGRRTMHLSMSDLSIFPGPEGQSTLEMAAQYSLSPHPLFPQVVFAWCRRFGPAEPRCDGCGRNFSTVARRQVPTVRKRRRGEKCDGRPGGRPGSVHSTTLATPAEQNRCQGGPRFTSTGPLQEPPPLASFLALVMGRWPLSTSSSSREMSRLASTS